MNDNQIFSYYKLGGKKQNNRLYSITDIATITSGKDLPSGQIAFDDEDLLNNNYRYNELGELVYDKQMGIDEITWGNNGKIRTVTHSDASGKYNLKFDYNHTGKRIAKHVYNQNNTLLRSEYYTRDASDNVMAVYRLEVDEQNQEVSFRLKERHIYGSSMLGIDRLELELIDPIAPNNTLNHIIGLKSYTGSNHLGNVLTTFSDKKLPIDENSDGVIDYYQPHIISSSDYAPFGAQLAERSFYSETYPNSFNDKRDDPELGDWQDYGMRMYSTWQRRFPTPDPLIVYGQEYPWYSPYQFAGNKPIWAVDLDGLEEYVKLAVEDKGGKVNTMRVIPWSEIYPAETHGPWGKGTVDYTLRDQPRNNNTRYINVRVQFQTNVNGVKINIDDNICVETRGKTNTEKYQDWENKNLKESPLVLKAMVDFNPLVTAYNAINIVLGDGKNIHGEDMDDVDKTLVFLDVVTFSMSKYVPKSVFSKEIKRMFDYNNITIQGISNIKSMVEKQNDNIGGSNSTDTNTNSTEQQVGD